MKRKFVRVDAFRHSKLGKNRPKLEKWRKPRGKQNKIRLKKTGHPQMPGVGFRSRKSERGKINGLLPFIARNPDELSRAGKNSIIIIGNVGAKKKLEIIRKAEEKNLPIFNAGGKK